MTPSGRPKRCTRANLAPHMANLAALGCRFGSLGRPPGFDLPCPHERFASSHAARACVTRTSSNSVKTPLKLSRNACRLVCAKHRGRRKNVARALRGACWSTTAYDIAFGASRLPSGGFPETPRTPLAPPKVPAAQPRSHPGALRGSFGAFPERPGTACGSPWSSD